MMQWIKQNNRKYRDDNIQPEVVKKSLARQAIDEVAKVKKKN